ncbi:MAG: sigma-70 family RNA polymerase sigma factor [Candidatus Aminicenantes bacterium]|nr:sigma-70 family RNA polymerase sigma factor [Candidatus Aminicenantes bacterium]
MKIADRVNETVRFGREQAGEEIKESLKFIKKNIKKRIACYDPLDFKGAYKEFVAWVQDGENVVFGEMPEGCTFEDYLDGLIKNFLIEKTYYYFLFEDQGLVPQFVTDIAKKMSLPLHLCLEITIFVREKLESPGKLAAIKKSFKERSKLKTYFFAMIRNLIVDYERKYNITKAEPNEENDLDKLPSSSLTPHTELEVKEIKERMDRLESFEKIAFKTYYYENVTNISVIARSLKTSFYKTKKILSSAKDKVLKGEI